MSEEVTVELLCSYTYMLYMHPEIQSLFLLHHNLQAILSEILKRRDLLSFPDGLSEQV